MKSNKQWLSAFTRHVTERLKVSGLIKDQPKPLHPEKGVDGWWLCAVPVRGDAKFELWLRIEDDSKVWYGLSATDKKKGKEYAEAISCAYGDIAKEIQEGAYPYLSNKPVIEKEQGYYWCGTYDESVPALDKEPSGLLVERAVEFIELVYIELRKPHDFPGGFDPENVEHLNKMKAVRELTIRQGSSMFRRKLIEADGGQCVITGCSVPELLDAAHIFPYNGIQTNTVDNGLLLRTDIHRLLDVGLIAIDPESRIICVSPRLADTPYQDHAGAPLKMGPTRPLSKKSLEWHRRRIALF